MKKYFFVLICLFTTFAQDSAMADGYESDFEFKQDRMLVDGSEIYIISSFDNQDGVSAYNFNGQLLWEARFHAKILSWNVQPKIIIVFSKDRDNFATYLTCIDRKTGRCLWQKP